MPEINPNMLRWARESAGLPLDLAAEKLAIDRARHVDGADRLAAYERGDEYPSRTLLRKMSKRYRRPLLAFYLDHIPAQSDSGHDFRMLPAGKDGETDHLLAPLLRELKARQGLLSSALREDEDREPVGFLGSLGRRHSACKAAAAMSELIGFNRAEFSAFSKPDEAFKWLRGKVEQAGVFVLLVGDLGSWHSHIEVRTFRGIALADEWAPFIVINANDARSAWSFTLLHELAHLLIGKSGVSGLVNADSAIERFCNDAASEVLMPAEKLARIELPHDFDLAILVEIIGEVATEQNISRSLRAYRLYRAGRLGRNQWIAIRDELAERWRDERERKRRVGREKEGGPNANVVRRYRLGNSLRAATKEMLDDGQLNTTKAAKVLGVHPRRLTPMIEDGKASS